MECFFFAAFAATDLNRSTSSLDTWIPGMMLINREQKREKLKFFFTYHDDMRESTVALLDNMHL